MRKNVSKTTTKCNAIKVLSVALLAGLSVIGSNPASADSTYSTLNDALVDATTPRSYTVSQEGETLSQNQDTVAAGDLKISGVSSETPSVLDASGKSIFNIANETNLILKDLDIKNAFTTGSGSVLKVTNKNATAELLNVRISNSSSNGDGGVIYNIGNISAITGYFTDNKIVENSSGNDGGAIYNVNGGHIGTIDAIFKNNGINNNNGYGGAIANEGATIDKISGQFIDNYVKTVNSTGMGGAIVNRNSNSIIGEINANFSGNFVESTNYDSNGGAISNWGKISSVSGVFNNNYTKSINYADDTGQIASAGGAIHNRGNIGDIKANFDGNFADSGKALAYGGAIYNKGNIGEIWGDFSNNRVISTKNPDRYVDACGAAIYNHNHSEIGNISGNFINNSASAVGSAYGGVIASWGKIGDIKGVFNGNKVISSSNNATGGAISNSGEMGNISATFMNNSIKGGSAGGSAIYNSGKIGNVAGNFVNNSALAKTFALGGALVNRGTIGSISGSFIGNSAKTSSDSQLAFGGAVYSNHTDLNFAADNTTNILAVTIQKIVEEN